MEKDLRKMTEEQLFDFIKNHREEFDSQLPDSKHEEKFFQKLGTIIKNAVISIIPHLVKVAIITLIVWVISVVSWKLFLDPKRDQMPLGKVSKEYRTMENRYQHDINSKTRNMFYFHRNMMNPTQRKELRTSLDSLDKDYINMKRELKKNPGNEEIIESMKNYYKIKSQIINEAINRIDTTKVK
jgi:hypothetical protein